MKTNKLQLIELDKSFEGLTSSYRHLREQFLKNNYNAESNWCIGVSAGHGGIDPITKEYVTNGKQFLHDDLILHDGGNFYEGVFNRQIADKLCLRLKQQEMVYEKFYHPYIDTPLREKSAAVNKHHANVKKTILFELHSNATPGHNARGFCVFTGPGQTDSDKLADVLWEYVSEFANEFGFKMRRDSKDDNDVDYEAKFHMCIKTACPTILPECLFFDNELDVILLNNPAFQDKYVEALLKTAIWGEKNL